MNKEEYEARKQARIERYKQRAEKATGEATRLWDESGQMARSIPFGQPILIGHHSERRDRNFRERIYHKQRRAVEATDKAGYWNHRAQVAEKNRAISSDDPEAASKLQAKIIKAEKFQEQMKQVNRLIKRKSGPDRDGLRAMGLTDEQVDKLLKPDFCGRIGFPHYALQNNNANIRRMKQRLETLQRREGMKTTTETIGEVEIVGNADENRVQILFPGKPPAEVRSKLKMYGFRWSPTAGAWQRQLSRYALDLARQIIGGKEGEGDG